MNKKYIIALGASVGALAALSQFFDNTLPDAVSYVITTHLYPHEKSVLADLLQSHSAMEVCEVEDDMEIRPNVVYVMPENKVMSIQNGRLKLTPRDLSLKVNKAIDIFFTSLAKDNFFKKVAIILTGMGNDGTEGVKMIAEHGGYIMAQKPDTAYQDSMPQAVITSGFADLILPVKQMPQAIINYLKNERSDRNA